MAESHLEKKHAATPRRRQRAREQGQVAVSSDLTSATLLLSAVAALWCFGGSIAAHLAVSMTEALSTPTMTGVDVATATSWIIKLIGRLAMAIVPLLIVMMLAGVLINLIQTGPILTPARIAPKLSNISLRAGLGRIFSARALARLAFGLLKVIVILAVAYAAVQQYYEPIMNLGALTAPAIAKTLLESLMGTCLWIGGALFLLALADYGFQRWKFEQDLMMTDEELREELKETEGDPQLTDRRRGFARELALNRGGGTVADMVVSQPHGPAAARKI